MYRAPRRPLADRLWEKVDKNGPIQPHMKTPCWLSAATVSGILHRKTWRHV